MSACHARNCLLDEEPGSRYCAIHRESCVAREMCVPPHTTCRKCKRTIGDEDLVSRTMLKEKHRTTGATMFFWQHYVCAPKIKVEKRKDLPLLSDMLLGIE